MQRRSLLALVGIGAISATVGDSALAARGQNSVARRDVEDAVDRMLTTSGFRRGKHSWTRAIGDGTQVVALQDSSWAEILYVNLGMWFARYGTPFRGAITDCHVRTRLESLVDFSSSTARALDFRIPMSNSERATVVAGAIAGIGVPWLEGVAQFSDAARFLARRTSRAVLIAPAARADLAMSTVDKGTSSIPPA
jgi:hypothetical protein